MKFIALLAFTSIAALAADNTLTPQEKKAGFRLLFDGKTFNGWQDPARQDPPGDAWLIDDGCLKTKRHPRWSEDLLTAEKYGDFELLFDWKLSERGNTGLKYRLQKLVYVNQSRGSGGPGGFEGLVARELADPKATRASLAQARSAQIYTIGWEFQLLDDERHPDAKAGGSHRSGALYSMIPPVTKADKPAGEWNSGRLVVRGNHFEHWVNGTKVLEGDLLAPQAKAGIEKRWKPAPAVIDILEHPQPEGWIGLQHHGDEVAFKNIKIRKL